MTVNLIAVQKLAEKMNWGTRELADKLGIEYSYLTRVMRGERTGGSKVLSGIYSLCKREGLNVDDYIFLEQSLSTNNENKVAI